jgi:hypothetical protein
LVAWELQQLRRAKQVLRRLCFGNLKQSLQLLRGVWQR